MKLKGATLAVREIYIISLRRLEGKEVTLKVAATPMGVGYDYDTIFPKPKPPFKVEVAKGQEPKKVYDYDDATFIAEFDLHSRYQKIYTFYRVLADADAELQFDVKPSSKSDLVKLAEEISEAGFSDGDIMLVLKAAASAANITNEDIQQATSNLS